MEILYALSLVLYLFMGTWAYSTQLKRKYKESKYKNYIGIVSLILVLAPYLIASYIMIGLDSTKLVFMTINGLIFILQSIYIIANLGYIKRSAQDWVINKDSNTFVLLGSVVTIGFALIILPGAKALEAGYFDNLVRFATTAGGYTSNSPLLYIIAGLGDLLKLDIEKFAKLAHIGLFAVIASYSINTFAHMTAFKWRNKMLITAIIVSTIIIGSTILPIYGVNGMAFTLMLTSVGFIIRFLETSKFRNVNIALICVATASLIAQSTENLFAPLLIVITILTTFSSQNIAKRTFLAIGSITFISIAFGSLDNPTWAGIAFVIGAVLYVYAKETKDTILDSIGDVISIGGKWLSIITITTIITVGISLSIYNDVNVMSTFIGTGAVNIVFTALTGTSAILGIYFLVNFKPNWNRSYVLLLVASVLVILNPYSVYTFEQLGFNMDPAGLVLVFGFMLSIALVEVLKTLFVCQFKRKKKIAEYEQEINNRYIFITYSIVIATVIGALFIK